MASSIYDPCIRSSQAAVRDSRGRALPHPENGRPMVVFGKPILVYDSFASKPVRQHHESAIDPKPLGSRTWMMMDGSDLSWDRLPACWGDDSKAGIALADPKFW
jgi:hypothetical protein